MKHADFRIRLGDALRLVVGLVTLASVSVAWSVTGIADTPGQSGGVCGELANAYGPYDYRKVRGPELKIVEDNHYNASVDRLVGGMTAPIGSDIDYTLRAFPNHHRALYATMRLAERQKTTKVPFMRYSVDCWFERAIRFAPDDTVSRLLFATHLGKTGRAEIGVMQAKYAGEVASESAITQHNVGLVMIELGQPDLAVGYAHRAMALGYPRDDLKRRLITLGKWREPASNSDEASSSSGATPVASPASSSTTAISSK